jgi:hypothetical protein
MTTPSLMILIAGPYRSGTGDDPLLMEQNLRDLEAAALPIFRAGHIPLIGEWLALPLPREAGSERPGDATYDEITRVQIPSGTPTIPAWTSSSPAVMMPRQRRASSA